MVARQNALWCDFISSITLEVAVDTSKTLVINFDREKAGFFLARINKMAAGIKIKKLLSFYSNYVQLTQQVCIYNTIYNTIICYNKYKDYKIILELISTSTTCYKFSLY